MRSNQLSYPASHSATRLLWFIPLRLINGQLVPPLSPKIKIFGGPEILFFGKRVQKYCFFLNYANIRALFLIFSALFVFLGLVGRNSVRKVQVFLCQIDKNGLHAVVQK